jgi:hypothetical protein
LVGPMDGHRQGVSGEREEETAEGKLTSQTRQDTKRSPRTAALTTASLHAAAGCDTDNCRFAYMYSSKGQR